MLSVGMATVQEELPDFGPSEADSNMVLFRYDENRTGIAPFSSDITNPRLKWEYQLNGDLVSSPLVADVNEDGRYEVVVGDDDGKLYVINEDGFFLYGASFQQMMLMTPAAGDVDGDGRLEVMAGMGSHSYHGGSLDIYALNGEDLSILWNYTSTSGSEHGFFASPMFHDSNADGILDVLVGSMDDYFYAFNGPDGDVIWKSPKGLHYIRTTSPMDDLDNDGSEEIIGLDNAALLRIYEADTGVVEVEKQLGYGVGASPLIADFDGDGYGEIACLMVVSGGIVVLNHDGSILWDNISIDDEIYTTPTIAHIDEDGLPDLIGGSYFEHMVFAFSGIDGTPLWQTVLPNNAYAQSSLVTADVDGDGETEVLAMGKLRDLFSIDVKTGAIEWTFNIERPFGQPTVWDLDQDGKAEIVVSGGGGKVYVIEQSPPPRFEPRTIGYWKHQCNIEDPKKEHPGITDDFVSAIAADSLVFSYIQSKDDVCEILWSKTKSDMMGKALKQLMALWLNVVSGYVDESAEIDLPDLTSAKTVGEAISEIEDILLNSYDKDDLERAKNIADTLNNGVRG